jgi:hypothetical protein
MDPLMSVGTAMLFWVLWALVFLFQRGAVAVRFPSRGVVEIAGSAAVLLGVDGFLCPVDACKRWFSNSAGFARHNQSSGHGTAPVAVRGVRIRYSYSFRRKRDLILELDGLEVPPYSRSKFCLKGQVWPKGISASGAQIVLRFLHMQGLVVSHVCAGFDLKKQNTLLQSSSSTLDLSGAGSTNVGAPIVPGSATTSPKF